VILPDANLLVAFTWENHEQKATAEYFFKRYPKVATCPLTELALVRVWMQKGASGTDADAALKDFISNYRSRLIPTISPPPLSPD
jgi:predicted nucleic acid-binding protein